MMHRMDNLCESKLDSLEDHEIIELLLNLHSYRRAHTKLAKLCIRQFGSLRGVVEAAPEELQQAGITPSAILYIRLIHEIPVRVLKQRIIDRPIYQSAEAIYEYLRYSMQGLKKEVLKVIYLNSRNHIIESLDLFEGTINNILISPRKVIESAISRRAVSMIFAHNHPSGDPAPSESDKRLTRDLVFIGSAIQIKVLDHIIIGDNSYFSFDSEKLIEKYEDSFLNLKMKAVD